jgi:hypothetical protein
MNNKKRGPAFATGSLRRPREHLVAWPSEASEGSEGSSIEEAAPPSIDPAEAIDVHEKLARAKAEIFRLLTRVQELSEENERLRRQLEERRSGG